MINRILDFSEAPALFRVRVAQLIVHRQDALFFCASWRWTMSCAKRTRSRAGASEKSRMRLIIGRKDISQGVDDHLPCFGLRMSRRAATAPPVSFTSLNIVIGRASVCK